MSLREPEVIAGARGPREERKTLGDAHTAKRGTGVATIPDGEVWYQARHSRLRVQLTSPPDVILPDGRVKRELPIVAQFDQSFLKLNPVKKEKDRKIAALLAEHPSLGTGFWNFQDVLDTQQKQDRDRTLTVLQDPDQRKLIIEALKADGVDIELPAPRTRSKSKDGEAQPAAD